MEFSHIKIWLMFFILYTEGTVFRNNIKNRFKRSSTSFLQSELGLSLQEYATVLHNSVPVECPQDTTTKTKRLTLSTDTLQSILAEKGGAINPELMAVEDASTGRFKNLLNLDSFQKEEHLDHHFQSTESPILKSQIENDLRKWSYLTNYLQSANRSRTETTTVIPANDNFHKHENYTKRHGNISVDQSIITNNAIYDNITDFLHHSNISFNELLAYMRSFKISTNPKILMTLQQRTKRDIIRNEDGSNSTQQYCDRKGTQLHGHFVQLCSLCAVTTKLSHEMFPRVINEVICGNDKVCLGINGHPQGACLPTEMHIPVLRRRPGRCMVNSTGHIHYVDHWGLYSQKVRTGCSCAIEKRSFLLNKLSLQPIVVG